MATDAKMASQRGDAVRPMKLQGDVDEQHGALVRLFFVQQDLFVYDCLCKSGMQFRSDGVQYLHRRTDDCVEAIV